MLKLKHHINICLFKTINILIQIYLTKLIKNIYTILKIPIIIIIKMSTQPELIKMDYYKYVHNNSPKLILKLPNDISILFDNFSEVIDKLNDIEIETINDINFFSNNNKLMIKFSNNETIDQKLEKFNGYINKISSSKQINYIAIQHFGYPEHCLLLDNDIFICSELGFTSNYDLSILFKIIERNEFINIFEKLTADCGVDRIKKIEINSNNTLIKMIDDEINILVEYSTIILSKKKSSNDDNIYVDFSNIDDLINLLNLIKQTNIHLEYMPNGIKYDSTKKSFNNLKKQK